jgi:hypothetical protein
MRIAVALSSLLRVNEPTIVLSSERDQVVLVLRNPLISWPFTRHWISMNMNDRVQINLKRNLMDPSIIIFMNNYSRPKKQHKPRCSAERARSRKML